MFNKLLFVMALMIAFSLAACEPRENDRPPAPTPEHQAPAETQQTDIDISENELDEYIDATQEATARQIDPETNRDEMEEILDDKEIDYNRFSEIHTAVQLDPTLQQQVQQRIQEREQDDFQIEN